MGRESVCLLADADECEKKKEVGVIHKRYSSPKEVAAARIK